MHAKDNPLILSRLLDRGADVAPQEEFVTETADGLHRQSFLETRARAHQLAHALTDAGIKPGDRVATMMWNSVRHFEAYHALACMGTVLHTLNIRLSPVDLEYIINHAADKIIIIDNDLLPLLEPIRDKIPTVKKIISVSLEGAKPSADQGHLIDYDDFIQPHPTHYEWPVLDENAPMGLCYTSGTTGKPKGVQYLQRSTYLHTIMLLMTDAMQLSATDVACGIVPMFHAMAWGVPWSALTIGMKQVLPHRFMAPDALVELIAGEEVTVSLGVPTIWQGVKAVIEANPDRYDLSHLERVTCGGSAPPESLIRWYWEVLDVEMIQGWGMTETSPLATISRRVMRRSDNALSDDQKFANAAKAGIILPGLQVEIFDENFASQPHDGEAIGELLIKGPWVCQSYYNDPQPDKFHDGWLITGDVAKIDPDGYLIITDRSKDLIKSGGEWISSVDMENHIAGLAEVAQACVVAQPHPKWDERPVAVVVRHEHSKIEAEEIIRHCAQAFAKWQLPDDVIFVDSIPLTSTGKMDKKVVRAQLKKEQYQLPDLRA